MMRIYDVVIYNIQYILKYYFWFKLSVNSIRKLLPKYVVHGLEADTTLHMVCHREHISVFHPPAEAGAAKNSSVGNTQQTEMKQKYNE